MRVGHSVLLYLSRHYPQFVDQWTFNPFSGYGLMDEGERLVFCAGIRGEPVAKFRRRVEWAAWPLQHSFEGRAFGHVFADSSDHPLAGARVALSGFDVGTTSDARGWFKLIGVPIGQHLLRVTGPCAAASSIVEISDEFSDTLEVRVPCKEPRR
jgi:hypothetical protein